MSFILDALKKSETERKRQDTPGIASIPETGQKAKNARWPWVVAGLLGINLIVLAAIMLQPSAPPEQPSAAVATPPPTESFSEIVREAKRTTPRPVAGTVDNSVAESALEPGSAVETVAVLPQPAPNRSVTEGLPTFNELRASGRLQLPDMHLDIHVYSGQPADRFVFVNMSKYKESATLSEGPRVREIVPDGVVLDYMGTRFLLPRE